MTMRVTMLQSRMGEAGTVLTAGSTYTVSDAYGRWLIGAGFSSDADGVLTEASQNQVRIQVTAARLAELVAASALIPNAIYAVGGEWFRALTVSTYAAVGAAIEKAYAYAADSGPITAAMLGNAKIVSVSGTGLVTVDQSLASSGRVLAFMPAVAGSGAFTVVPNGNISAANWVVEGGGTASSTEAVSNTVYIGCFDDGKARVLSGVAATPYVYNRSALKKWARRYGEALSRNVNVGLFGDSLAYGNGATGGSNTDDTAETYGLAGTLRRALNSKLGTKGGGWINSNDTRVTNVNGSALTAFGPMYQSSFANSRSLNSAGTQTYALPGGTAVDLYVWQDTAASYGIAGSQISYNIDGAGAVTLTGTGGSSVFRIINGPTNLAEAAHSMVLSWVAGSNAICGAFWKYATGVSVIRMAVGGFTSSDLLGRTLTGAALDRLMRSTYDTIPLDLAIILCGHNDCSLQGGAAGSTPAGFKANVQAMITRIQTNNPKAPPILLLSDPDPNLTGTPYSYAEYWPMLKQLANENANVSAVIWREVMGTYAEGNAESAYADQVHQTNTGYARMARFLAETLSLPAA